MQISTYTSGFTFVLNRDITKNDYITLCQSISDQLNNYHNLTGVDLIKIMPEAITEGGFKFTGGKNKSFGDSPFMENGKQYKTMRHFCNIDAGTYNRSRIEWPRIDNETINKWINCNEIIFPQNMTGETYLKAFDGAPAWTLSELNIFKSCMENYGFIINNIPKANSLKYK
jgi:hypothetical protein